MMKKALPRPSDLLEELANKVIDGIDSLAVGSFKAALDEMIEYHGFLLDAYATKTEEGMAFSYAEIEGNWFGGPHHEWIRQYSRIFERAAGCIGQETEFIGTLAYVPIRLLDGRVLKLSAPVIDGILNLDLILVSRLEDWLARRVSVENVPGESASPKLALAGSDKAAFSDVLFDVVGAWERVLQHIGSLYDWKDIKRASYDKQWKALAGSWPFFWHHLRNSAYFVALAVWNEDEIGAEQFRVCLLRWPEVFHFELEDRFYSSYSGLIVPDLFKKEWSDVEKRLEEIEGRNINFGLSPFSLFSTISGRAHNDAVLITSGVLLRWFTEEKQSSDIAARTAAALLNYELVESDDGSLRGHSDFSALFFDMARFAISGERFDEESYGAYLDGLAAQLDQMSERRVVPGRIFTPSTIHGTHDLFLSFAIILMLRFKGEADERVVDRLRQVVSEERRLPQGDRSVVDLIRFFEGLSNAMERADVPLRRVIAVFKPSAGFDFQVAQNLKHILDSVVSVLKDWRIAEIKKLPIDEDILEKVRISAEAAATTPPANIGVVRDFNLERSEFETSIATVEANVVTGLPRGLFTRPPREELTSEWINSINGWVTALLARGVWHSFWDRKREKLHVADDPSSGEFWNVLRPQIDQLGQFAALILPQSERPAPIIHWLHSPEERPKGLLIERKLESDRGTGHYVVTVNGVDVYFGAYEGNPVLLSSRSLKSVRYEPVEDDHFLDLTTVDEADPWNLTLRVRFAQSVEWDSSPVFEIVSSSENEAVTQ